MTLSQFIETYTGRKVDYDGKFGGQCVDLFRLYVKEVLSLPQPKGVIGAADFWTNYDTDEVLFTHFTKIANSPSFIPIAGDVMIWNKKVGGGFGHIAIVSDKLATTSSFTSFDQNWKTISVSELIAHTYTHVLGVLRVKTKENHCYTEQEMSVVRLIRDANWQLYQEQLTKSAEFSKENSEVRRQLDNQKDLHTRDLERIAIVLNVGADISKILPALETCILFEDQATELQKKLIEESAVYERRLHIISNTLETLGKDLQSAKAEILLLKEQKPEIVPTQPQGSLLHRLITLFLRK